MSTNISIKVTLNFVKSVKSIRKGKLLFEQNNYKKKYIIHYKIFICHIYTNIFFKLNNKIRLSKLLYTIS